MNLARVLPIVMPLAALLGCSGGGGSSGTTSAPAWEKFRHDAGNTGQGTGALTTATPRLKWTAEIDAPIATRTPAAATPGTPCVVKTPPMSSPVIALDGTVYVASQGGTLAAVDPTGSVRWRVSSCEACPAPSSVGSFVASPAVYTLAGRTYIMVASVGTDAAQGGIFIFTSVGAGAPSCVGCFQPQDRTKNPDADSIAAACFVSSPTFTTNSSSFNIAGIFVGAQIQPDAAAQPVGKVYALNSDGTLQWEFPPRRDAAIGPVNSSLAVGTANTLYFTAADGNLYALGSIDGVRRANVPVGAAGDADSPLISSPLTDTTIYAGTASGVIFARNPDITVKWNVTPDDLHLSSADAALVGSLALGNPAETPTPIISTTPTSTATPQVSPTLTATPLQSALELFGVTKSGMVIAVEVATSNARVLRGLPADAVPVVSSPALTSDGILVFGDHAGNLHAIRTDDGSELAAWPYHLAGGPITSSPAIADDGTIYVVGGDGVLYAVSTR